MKKTILLSFCIYLVGGAFGQTVTLPYYSGFDNTSQTTGWTEYKKAGTETGGWFYSTTESQVYSPPKSLWQIYSTSENVDNWFVSPGFMIPSGGNMDSIRYKCAGFSEPGDNDTIALYLLNGNQDPSLATSRTLLFDIRGVDYVNDYIYKKKTNLHLPAGAGLSYFAIRFRCTAEVWLETYFDNLKISSGTTNINESGINRSAITLYPNPASESLTIDNVISKQQIQLYNLQGMLLKEFEIAQPVKIDINDLAKGVYIIRPKNHPELSQKFIKQ